MDDTSGINILYICRLSKHRAVLAAEQILHHHCVLLYVDFKVVPEQTDVLTDRQKSNKCGTKIQGYR